MTAVLKSAPMYMYIEYFSVEEKCIVPSTLS